LCRFANAAVQNVRVVFDDNANTDANDNVESNHHSAEIIYIESIVSRSRLVSRCTFARRPVCPFAPIRAAQHPVRRASATLDRSIDDPKKKQKKKKKEYGC
jgi:hypothetical protein